MQTALRHQGPLVRVVDYVCSARRGERAFEETHASVNVALVRRGVFTYRTENRRDVLGPGDFLLGNAGQSYECVHEHTDGDVCTCFEFSPRALESVAREHNLATPRLRASRAQNSRKLALDVSDALLSASYEEVALSMLATLLTDGAPKAAASLTPSQVRRIGEVLSWMDAHYAEELALDDFAGLARLSPYHFLRVFRAHVGTTPHQYLTRVRLMRSAEALRQSDESVTRVAFASGFRDLSHFTHTFKKAFGESPGAYRTARNPKSQAS